jgi:hypothetical protein
LRSQGQLLGSDNPARPISPSNLLRFCHASIPGDSG